MNTTRTKRSMMAGRASLVVALVLIGSLAPAFAQTQTDAEPQAETDLLADSLEAAQVEAMRASVENDAGLDEVTRTRALDLYRQALSAIEQRTQVSARDAELAEKLEEAQRSRAELEAILAKGETEAPFELPEGADAIQLRALAAEKSADLMAAREKLTSRSQNLAKLRAGATFLDDRLAEILSELTSIDTSVGQLDALVEPQALREAREVFLRARRGALTSESRLVRRQLENFDLIVLLETLEQEVAEIEVRRIESSVEKLELAVTQESARESALSRRRAEAAAAAAALLPGSLVQVAEENLVLQTELERISAATNESRQTLRSKEKQLDDIKRELETTRLRVERLGPTPAVGRLLRRRLDRLPSPVDFRRSSRQRQSQIDTVTDRRIDIEEELTERSNVERQVGALLRPLQSKDLRFDEAWLTSQAEELVNTRLLNLTELTRTYRIYVAQLISLNVTERELAATVEEAAEFITRELIWIRSLDRLSLDDFRDIPQVLAPLTDQTRWRRALTDMRNEFKAHPFGSTVSILAVALCFLVRRRAPALLADLGAKARLIQTDSFLHTAKAFAYTTVAAGAWPLAIAFVGWHLHSAPRADFSAALGAGFFGLATFQFSISIIRWVFYPKGLGRSHFRWPGDVAASLRREHFWLGMVGWILVPTVGTVQRLGDPALAAAFERPLFMLGLLALTIFAWRALGPSSVFARYFESNHPDYWFVRLRPLWFPLVVLSPIALMVASAMGFQYTAETFAKLLTRETVWFLISLLLLRAMLLRWFILSERRLRLEAAMRHREEARQEREQEDKDKDKGEAETFDIEIPEPDYRELGQQARSLVRVGVFVGVIVSLAGLWGDFVPFYAFLENFTLPYSKTTLVEGAEQQVPATLADLGLGLVLLVATVLAVKNLPGLLEFTAFRYLSLDAGARYAFLTLTQYLIVAFGVIVALSTIGMQWQKLQWLVAALGVGLGFGLQEIVANFVSGIILLLERPIRAGDIVTVGDTTGAVSRFRIRATTIQTYDSQELLVPNKEFITGRLLNWTLSDPVARILLYVGIAYGSDVEKALKLILEAAVEQERVLDDPAPNVNFEGFGDNSLNLSLRAYVDSLDYRLTVQTALHKAIYAKFNAAGIEISFPQRDVHLDARKPLEVRVLGPEAELMKGTLRRTAHP